MLLNLVTNSLGNGNVVFKKKAPYFGGGIVTLYAKMHKDWSLDMTGVEPALHV